MQSQLTSKKAIKMSFTRHSKCKQTTTTALCIFIMKNSRISFIVKSLALTHSLALLLYSGFSNILRFSPCRTSKDDDMLCCMLCCSHFIINYKTRCFFDFAPSQDKEIKNQKRNSNLGAVFPKTTSN